MTTQKMQMKCDSCGIEIRGNYYHLDKVSSKEVNIFCEECWDGLMEQATIEDIWEYHNCPVHGKEKCFTDPKEPKHSCQAIVSYKVRKGIPSWTEVQVK